MRGRVVMFTNADITVINSNDSDTFFTHIRGVFWNETKGSTTDTKGTHDTDSIEIRIPLDSIKALSKPYADQSITISESTWTLSPDKTFICKGIYDKQSLSVLMNKTHMTAVVEMSDLRFGSETVQHLWVRCK